MIDSTEWRARLAGLKKSDLNGIEVTVLRPIDNGLRFQVRIVGNESCKPSLSIKPENLRRIPTKDDVAQALSRKLGSASDLCALDMTVMCLASRYGVVALSAPDLRPLYEAAGRMRQDLLFKWTTFALRCLRPESCINQSVPPTIALGLVAARDADPHAYLKWSSSTEHCRIHIIGATPDFDHRADWSSFLELLTAGGLHAPAAVEVTYVGVESSFATGGIVDFESAPLPPSPPNFTLKSIKGHYHTLSLEPPEVVLLAHPGFYEDSCKSWVPTIMKLIDAECIIIVTGHSNFSTFSHDASGLGVALDIFRARKLLPVTFNPFCQVYDDAQKNSCFVDDISKQNLHANMAVLAVFCGGDGSLTVPDAEQAFCRLDYLTGAVSSHVDVNDGRPKMNHPNMPNRARFATLQLMRDLMSGKISANSAKTLEEVIIQADPLLAQHFYSGKDNW